MVTYVIYIRPKWRVDNADNGAWPRIYFQNESNRSMNMQQIEHVVWSIAHFVGSYQKWFDEREKKKNVIKNLFSAKRRLWRNINIITVTIILSFYIFINNELLRGRQRNMLFSVFLYFELHCVFEPFFFKSVNNLRLWKKTQNKNKSATA